MRKFIDRFDETHEQFVERRKKFLGGSDVAHFMRVGPWACPLRLFKDKTGIPKDFDDSDRMELRRGRRLEHVAIAYYEERTGRTVCYTSTQFAPGKPHLAVNMDAYAYREDDTERKNPGYVEAKVVGKSSFLNIKKSGVPDSWILQLQWGCEITGCKWGSFAVYCPELDEMLAFDVEADRELGRALVDGGDDFWSLNIECGVEPDPLPEGSTACESCPWSLSCRGKTNAALAAEGIVSRPDLEALAAKYKELSGMGSEVDDAKASVREELLEAIGRKPGAYNFGRYAATFTVGEQRRFDSKIFQKAEPELYEKFRKASTTETLRIKE